MCTSSPKTPKPAPVAPPPADPAEFLNEELQQNASSRKILGIRQLQSGFAGGGGGSVEGGSRGLTLGALSRARAANVGKGPSAGPKVSVKAKRKSGKQTVKVTAKV
jgi:hypothetical protein